MVGISLIRFSGIPEYSLEQVLARELRAAH